MSTFRGFTEPAMRVIGSSENNNFELHSAGSRKTHVAFQRPVGINLWCVVTYPANDLKQEWIGAEANAPPAGGVGIYLADDDESRQIEILK
jgi:hypothetical protein